MKALVLAVIAIVLAGFSVFHSFHAKPRIAYIEMGKIYENFKLKKELDVKLKKSDDVYTHLLDSMKFLITELYNELNGQPVTDKIKLELLQQMEKGYQYRSQQQEEAYQNISKEYNEKIWKRINEYVEAYGKSKNYEFIFGANGLGSIMYGNAADNITEEMTEYINNQFEGKDNEQVDN